MAEGDPTLRVPTLPVRVVVAFAGEHPHEMEIFAPGAQMGRPARARVAALLERDQRFLPARDLSSGEWVTLGVRALSWIAVPQVRAEGVFEVDDLYEHRRDVRIELGDGGSLEGELLYSAPASSTRVVDVLNADSRMLTLWLADGVVFINKAFVHRVVEIPHAHRPSQAPAEPAPPRSKPKTKPQPKPKPKHRAKPGRKRSR